VFAAIHSLMNRVIGGAAGLFVPLYIAHPIWMFVFLVLHVGAAVYFGVVPVGVSG